MTTANHSKTPRWTLGIAVIGQAPRDDIAALFAAQHHVNDQSSNSLLGGPLPEVDKTFIGIAILCRHQSEPNVKQSGIALDARAIACCLLLQTLVERIGSDRRLADDRRRL